jgi:hypothetical protein
MRRAASRSVASRPTVQTLVVMMSLINMAILLLAKKTKTARWTSAVGFGIEQTMPVFAALSVYSAAFCQLRPSDSGRKHGDPISKQSPQTYF